LAHHTGDQLDHGRIEIRKVEPRPTEGKHTLRTLNMMHAPPQCMHATGDDCVTNTGEEAQSPGASTIYLVELVDGRCLVDGRVVERKMMLGASLPLSTW